MTSITGWNRIEPVPRDQTFREGLEAPVYDPAWTIARQWQVGEFTGSDRGSAVLARISLKSERVTGYRSGDAQNVTVPFNGRLPIEAIAEAETASDFGPTGWLDRSEAGLSFLRLLTAHPDLGEERALWIANHGFPELSSASLAELLPDLLIEYEDLRQSSPDGAQLADYLGGLITGTEVPPAQYGGRRAELEDVARLWLDQWATVFDATVDRASAWQDERMEYAFELVVTDNNGDDRAILLAKEYHGGTLDWDSFDIRHETARDLNVSNNVGDIEIACIPMPVDFAGMPAPRWWEFEDAKLALPQVEAAPDDLIKLVLVDFALVYGGDWLLVPLELECGSIHQIRRLIVTDTFGQDIEIGATVTDNDPLRAWTMHHLSESGASINARSGVADQVLFQPPNSAGTLTGEARERVEIGRDEVANFALAREKVTQSPLGAGEDREQANRLRQLSSSDPSTIAPRYRLANAVPDFWIPLVPETGADQRSIRLRRGAFLDPETGTPMTARGRVLVPEKKLRVEEEEISRLGLTIRRQTRLARGTDGETVVWHARIRKAGKGDAESGIAFDRIEDT